MRTTIDLPDDLHQAVVSIAAHSRRSMNQTVADLIRRGLAPRSAPPRRRCARFVSARRTHGPADDPLAESRHGRRRAGAGRRMTVAPERYVARRVSPVNSVNPIHLLDGNVLHALIDEAHVHHAAARRWFGDLDGRRLPRRAGSPQQRQAGELRQGARGVASGCRRRASCARGRSLIRPQTAVGWGPGTEDGEQPAPGSCLPVPLPLCQSVSQCAARCASKSAAPSITSLPAAAGGRGSTSGNPKRKRAAATVPGRCGGRTAREG